MHSPSVSALEPVHSHASIRSVGVSLSQLSHASLKQISALSGSRASIHSRTQPDSNAVGGPSAKTLYRERMELCLDWFSGWSDGQRKKFLSRLGVCLKPTELLQLASLVEHKAPKEQLDFTQVLTREISLHILSYLDPRSLSRCAQVSWHWLWLSEQDSIWQPKCVERGWYLHYSPLPKQYGAWKQHYVACLLAPPTGVYLPPSSQHLRTTPSPLLTIGTVPTIQPEDWDDTVKQQFQLSQSTDDPQLQTYTCDPSLPFYLPPQKPIKGDQKPWLDPDPHPADLEKGWRYLCEGSLPMHRSVEFQKHGSLHPSTYSAVSRTYSKASAFHSTATTYWRSPSPRRQINRLTDSLKLEDQQEADFLRASTAPASLSGRGRMLDSFKPIPVSALTAPDPPWYQTPGLPSEEGKPLFYSPPWLYNNSATLSPPTRDLHYYAYPHTDYCSLARGLPTLYHPRLILFPSTLLSWQLLAAAAQPDTLCLVFDPSDITLPTLSRKIDSLLAGRIARSIALFSPLASNCLPLGSILSFGPRANLVDSESYDSLWEGDSTAEESLNFLSSLRKYLLPSALGSRIDIFSPSPPPDKLHPRLASISTLSKLLQVPVSCPSSLTALYSLRNEEWSWVTPSHTPEEVLTSPAPSHTPPSLYFLIPSFLSWCHLAESCTLAICRVEQHLSGYLKQTSFEVIGALAGKIVHHALALNPASEMVATTNYLRPILLKYSSDTIGDQLDKNAFCDDVIGILKRQGEEFEEEHPILAPEVWPSHLLGPNAGSCSWFEGSKLSQRLCYPMLWGHNLTEWGTCTPPKDRRGLVLWEWYHTELTYSHMLQLVLNEYQRPLKVAMECNNSQPLGLTSHELDILFADIQLLKNASTDQIAQLDHILTSWESSNQPPVSLLLSFLLSSLATYKNYVFNYPALTRMLNQAMSTSGRLRVFLRRAGLQPYTSHCSLPILLMAPLQRLRNLHQLLSSLLSLTPDTHADTKDATALLAKISSLLVQLDLLEKRVVSERELSSLTKAITGCPVLIETGRELLRSWRVELMVNTSQNGEKRLEGIDSLKLYIFSDALLLSRIKEYHHGFTAQVVAEEEFLDGIGISRLSVCEISTGIESVGCELRGSKKAWKVAFQSEEERNSFLECFVSLNKSV